MRQCLPLRHAENSYGGQRRADWHTVFRTAHYPLLHVPGHPLYSALSDGCAVENAQGHQQVAHGLAVIDEENCLSWLGLRCEVCYRVCPVKGKAITVENHPRKISKHAMFVPLMHAEHCTGCGLCEQACPTQTAAIRIVNPSLVQGKIGDHYRLGWKQEDAITQNFVPPPVSSRSNVEPPAPKTAPGMDVLNQGVDY